MSKHEESSRKSRVAVKSVMFWQEKFQRSRYFGQQRLRKFSKIAEKVWKPQTGVNISNTKLQEKQRRSRRISEIAEDVTPADCSLDFEGISSPQSQAITTTRLVAVLLVDSTEIVQESAWGMTQAKGARKCQ